MKRIYAFICTILAIMPSCAQKTNEVKTLVAYFSATGTTRTAAEQLAEEHQAALWEIEAAQPYTADDLNWRNEKSRSSIEMKDPEARPTIRQCTDITPYDTIYVGFPIWWGICPRIINSWIDNNLEQLVSKTLVPFATSGSSGVEKAENYLKQTYPSLKWEKGLLLNKH